MSNSDALRVMTYHFSHITGITGTRKWAEQKNLEGVHLRPDGSIARCLALEIINRWNAQPNSHFRYWLEP